MRFRWIAWGLRRAGILAQGQKRPQPDSEPPETPRHAQLDQEPPPDFDHLYDHPVHKNLPQTPPPGAPPPGRYILPRIKQPTGPALILEHPPPSARRERNALSDADITHMAAWT